MESSEKESKIKQTEQKDDDNLNDSCVDMHVDSKADDSRSSNDSDDDGEETSSSERSGDENFSETDEEEAEEPPSDPPSHSAFVKPASKSGQGRGRFRRKNIRKIIEDEKLSSATLDAQQQERERLQRVAAAEANYATLTQDESDEGAKQCEIWKRVTLDKPPANDLSVDEVITLSSDEDESYFSVPAKKFKQVETDPASDNDSDVICLDDEVDYEEEEKEDKSCVPSSSDGSHTNDLLNVPDTKGKMLVNVGHSSDDPDVFIPNHLTKIIKPHQLGGIRFMYDNIVESLSNFNERCGFGCILAHSMGLGKTLQLITFVDIFYRHTAGKRILILVPINTLQNWMNEFDYWLPKNATESAESSSSSSENNQENQENQDGRIFNVFVMNDKAKTTQQRWSIIEQWYNNTGVLLMGYEMFRLLSNKDLARKQAKPKNKKNNNDSPVAATNNNNSEPANDATLLEKRSSEIRKMIIDPGPDLIICDEGHRIKNMQTSTAKALMSVKTKRRVVLTGYPLQNNMMEYWCMVNFVRPNYLGSKSEFANMFERPVKNGQCVDSTADDVRIMRYRVHVLSNLLKGFVQRRGHLLLKSFLPPKEEFILFLRKSPIQHTLYRRFVVHCRGEIADQLGNWNPLKAFAMCCKIWNHPDILYNVMKNHESLKIDNDLDIGDLPPPSTVNNEGVTTKQAADFSDPIESSPNGSTTSSAGFLSQSSFIGSRSKREDTMDFHWAEDVFGSYVTGIVENGHKILLMLAILERCVLVKDKLLMFSQSLFTLNLVEDFLSKTNVAGSQEKWAKNVNYFRLDGSVPSSEREKLISRFNGDENVHLFLISTRAGSLGINLIGANRVIVFDASWNPCHDAQAVCRVYRYGQVKPTYIYRLVTDNSMERTIFNRQLGKQGMSDRIVDEKNVDAQVSRNDVYNLLQYDESQDMVSADWNFDSGDIEDDLLYNICLSYKECLSQHPVHHESLLLDRSDQTLSAREKREAQKSYEQEKKALQQYNDGSYVRRNLVLSALPNNYLGDSINSISDPAARPLRCTPLPRNLRATLENFDKNNGAGDGGVNGNSPVSGKSADSGYKRMSGGVETRRVLSPCSITLPSATKSLATSLVLVNEPIDIIRTHRNRVYVLTSAGHLLDAKGSIFDQNQSYPQPFYSSSHVGSTTVVSGASRFHAIPIKPATSSSVPPEEITLSDDDDDEDAQKGSAS